MSDTKKGFSPEEMEQIKTVLSDDYIDSSPIVELAFMQRETPMLLEPIPLTDLIIISGSKENKYDFSDSQRPCIGLRLQLSDLEPGKECSIVGHVNKKWFNEKPAGLKTYKVKLMFPESFKEDEIYRVELLLKG